VTCTPSASSASQRKPSATAVAPVPVKLDGAAKLAFDDWPTPPPLPEKPPKKPRKV
jgi:hypothetical protein